ncbi:MAG TPA: hypothetical protein VN655_04830 [Pseudolabrys sp.]|jgi:hypothetical protein|nr:hypothetical protein [Pseudolabrys sp.]
MRKSIKHLTITAATVAAVTFIALGTTSAVAAVGNGQGARGGDATQAYPAQDNCMQSPASTSYTPCWTGGSN